MQDPLKGVPIKTVSTFMYKIPSVFSGRTFYSFEFKLFPSDCLLPVCLSIHLSNKFFLSRPPSFLAEIYLLITNFHLFHTATQFKEALSIGSLFWKRKRCELSENDNVPPIKNISSGADCVSWIQSHYKFSTDREAVHLASLLASHGYIFPIDDHIMTVRNDTNTLYRSG